MRRIVSIVAAAIVPLAGLTPSQAAEVRLQMSNFRFCAASADACGPQDQAYLATPQGGGEAAVEEINPLAVTQVRPGDTVVWVYTDALCDAIQGCPGHAIAFLDGEQTEQANAREGAIELSWTVPEDAEGTIPYFCPINEHYNFGMTGALEVVTEGGY